MHLKNKTQPKLLYTVLPNVSITYQDKKKKLKQFSIFLTNDLPKLTLYTNKNEFKKKIQLQVLNIYVYNNLARIINKNP